MNTERIKALLIYRGLMWHKATSFRAKPKFINHCTVCSDGSLSVNLVSAVKEAEKATPVLRKSFYNLAVTAGEELVQALIEETEEVRPDPYESFEYEGHMYYLQSTEGENRTYKRYDVFDKDKVVFKPITHAQRIRKEIITEYELGAIKVMASTPSEIEN